MSAAILAAGALLGGCAGVSNPYATPAHRPTLTSTRTTTTGSTSTAGVGDPAPERNGTIAPGAQAAEQKLAAGAASATPQAAIDRYTQLYVNWSAANGARQQRQLAAVSLGQARAQALQAAASAARDPLLTRSQVTNRGQIISIASGQGAGAGQWVIVTSERSNGQGAYGGLPATLHVTYATVTHTTHGWVISQWKPQN